MLFRFLQASAVAIVCYFIVRSEQWKFYGKPTGDVFALASSHQDGANDRIVLTADYCAKCCLRAVCGK